MFVYPFRSAFCILARAAALVALATGVAADEHDAQAGGSAHPRNVIFLLGDGMGPAQVKAYRVFADDPATPEIDALAIDAHLVGAVATESVALVCAEDDPERCTRDPYGVTDSAASATAYASGRDTVNGMIGQGPDGERFASVLEKAAAAGLGTGIVSTSQVTHASPAAFYAHVPSRRQYAAIADQLFDNQVNGQPLAQVILGGGMTDLRRDDRDLVAEFAEAGYAVVGDSASLAAVRDERVLGLFAPVGLPRSWDRPPSVPSLADMTRKAIELLAARERGFFLLVEGSQVDWAAHGNDIAGTVSEMQDFMAAIETALAFAAARGDTLVLVTADHETGGLSLGRDGVYAWDPRPLRRLSATPAAMTERFIAGDEPLSAVISAAASLVLTPAEIVLLDAVERDAEAAYAAINELLDLRTHTGWATSGHTGVDVPLYATGPGADRFRGTLNNEEVGRRLLQLVAP